MNQDFDTVENIIFLDTEAFTSYWAKRDPSEIKPIRFDTDTEQVCPKNQNVKRLLTIVDLD